MVEFGLGVLSAFPKARHGRGVWKGKQRWVGFSFILLHSPVLFSLPGVGNLCKQREQSISKQGGGGNSGILAPKQSLEVKFELAHLILPGLVEPMDPCELSKGISLLVKAVISQLWSSPNGLNGNSKYNMDFHPTSRDCGFCLALGRC